MEQKTLVQKSWHFDPKTERSAKPEKAYQLLAATDSDLQKVADFYQHHSVAGYGLTKVEVIYNRGFNQGFELHLQKLQRRHNNSAFAPKWSTMSDASLRKKAYDQFMQITRSYADPDYPDVKLLPAWHGTKPQVLDSIFSAGYANLATTDNGYFGKGYYSAYEAEYSYRVYSQGTLILNWVASYSPLPVVNNDMQALALEGKSNYGNYDAHFVPVRPRFPDNPNETVYYPCTHMDEQQYTEMVVFESAALLPRYLVELGSEGLNLKSLVVSSRSQEVKSDSGMTSYHRKTETKLVFIPESSSKLGESAKTSVSGMDSQGWYQSIQPNPVLISESSSKAGGFMKASGSGMDSQGWYQSSLNQMEASENSLTKSKEGNTSIPFFQALKTGNHNKPSEDISPRSLCTQGREHEKNRRYEQAFSCYQKAANRNFADGLYKLSFAFFSGMGCVKDEVKGFQLSQKAAEQGHSSAAFNTGRAYEKGLGCSVNLSQAQFWYQKAAEGSDADVKKRAQDKLNLLTPKLNNH